VVFRAEPARPRKSLYLAGILCDPANAAQPLPVVLTGPRGERRLFRAIARFIRGTLGKEALERFTVITGNPAEVARHLARGIDTVRMYRSSITIRTISTGCPLGGPEFQRPFEVTHESMRALQLKPRPTHGTVWPRTCAAPSPAS